MALRPLHDRLLVKRLEEKEQVQGGIIIPDTAKEKPQQATVLAVGPGRVTDDGKLHRLRSRLGTRWSLASTPVPKSRLRGMTC